MDEHLKAEATRRRRVNRRSDWVTLAANAVGAVLSQMYFVVSGKMEFSGSTEASIWVLLISGGGLVALLVLGANVGRRRYAPLYTWYLHPRRHPKPPTPEMQRLALNIPANAALTSLAMWGLAGLGAGIFAALGSDEGFKLDAFLIVFLGIAGLSGMISATLVYFIEERIWQGEYPIFFPEGGITQVRAFRLGIHGRVLVLFLMAAVPLLLLAVTVYNQATVITQAEDPVSLLPILRNVEVFLVGVGGLAALTLALTLGASLIQSVEHLRAQMKRVRRGDLDAHLPLTSNDEFGELAEGFNAMVQGLQQEEVIRHLFSVYVTPEVAEHAITHGVELGGQLTAASVLFSDIRSFTAMTERMAPEALIALLNRYFQAMSGTIIEAGGLVNKFGGDSILAVFGTPLNPAADHAARAVRAARGMLAALVAFNADQAQRGEPTLRIGIGLATGPVVAGNVGSEERLEYTVIGNTVNLASRLQTMTKTLDAPVLLDAATARAVADTLGPDVALAPIGEIEIRGKQAPVPVHTLKEVPE
jgi:class 3 adenylate cyclase